jgi:hypothetical protein
MSDQPHNKVDLATQQLDEAIGLFLEGQFVSALRLAGAADEILAKALSDSGKQNFLDWKYEEVEPFHTILHRPPLSKEDFIRGENRALSAVTHASASNSPVTLDLEEAAYSMIVRACHNYDLLGLPRTAKMHKFDNWFSEHVIGLADPLPEVCDCA